MPSPFGPPTGTISETIRGIVDRVTFPDPESGWSLLRVLPFNSPRQQETVIVHQTKVVAVYRNRSSARFLRSAGIRSSISSGGLGPLGRPVSIPSPVWPSVGGTFRWG